MTVNALKVGNPSRKRPLSQDAWQAPTVAELFLEIVTPLLDSADDLSACSAVEALERQEPFINQILAYHSLAMLARLFRYGELTHHGGFVSLANGRTVSLTIRTARSLRGLKRAA